MRARTTVIVILALLASGCGATPPPPAERAPMRDGFVDVEGARLYFKTLGAGDPIVFVHGGPGFDHRQFLPYVWDLAEEHQVILYDQRGTGLSTGVVDSTSITIDTFLSDIDAIRVAFGIERMNLFGHSWGGMLALHYAVTHPDRLRSLIVASTAATHESFAVMRSAVAERRSEGDAAALDSIVRSPGFREQRPAAIRDFWRVYFRTYFEDPALVDGLDLTFTDNTIRHSSAVSRLILGAAGPFDLHERLRSVDVPALILHGDADPMPLRYAERIDESLPRAELVVLQHSGHWVFVDAMPQITAVVQDFLARADAAGAP